MEYVSEIEKGPVNPLKGWGPHLRSVETEWETEEEKFLG